MLNLGIIGYGFRAFTVLKELLKTGEVKVTAVCDVNYDSVKKYADENGVGEFSYYTDAKEMLQKEKLDGVFVGTRCSSHTDFARLVASYGIPLFLEKPVATNREDVERLKEILYHSDKTVVSFPLRVTDIVLRVREIIESGRIGTLSQVQAYNNVSYGRVYYHDWYRDDSETGGLFLQKSTHDFDYINYIIEQKPVQICAMNSKQIMKGNKPAGLKCEDCPEQYTCKEGPYMTRAMGDYVHGPYCCYSEDVGNEDSGTAIVRYESGMHMVYTQNFFVRNKHAAKRGAIFSGEGGTVEFDWVTSEIKVRKNYTPHDCVYKIETVGNHGGGDIKLADNFYDVMMGTDVSHTPLEEGLSSAYLCLKAKESAETGKFVDIEYKG